MKKVLLPGLLLLLLGLLWLANREWSARRVAPRALSGIPIIRKPAPSPTAPPKHVSLLRH